MAVGECVGDGLQQPEGYDRMIVRQGTGYWIDEDQARDIVSFLERVTPRGSSEADLLQDIVFSLDPKAGDHDR